MREWINEQPKRLLLSLVAIDLVFVALHVLTDGGRGPLTSLDTDRGFGGVWGFGQAVVAAVLVYEIFRRTQLAVYAAWAATFVMVALDDILELHENGGLRLANAVDLPEVAGLRGQDVGEMLVWAMLGIPLLVAIAVTVRHADRRGRRDSVTFFVLMSVLVFFAAGLDALHMMGTQDAATMWDVTPAGMVEDGGEMVVLSLVVSSAVAAHRFRRAADSEQPTLETTSS